LSSKQKGPWPSHSAYRSFPRNHDSAPNTTNDPGLPLLDGHLHSVGQTIAFGERRGQRVRRIGFSRQGELMEFKGPQSVARSGFSLHAARHIHREDRQGLSQLIYYMARPPIAEERLTRNAAGDIEYKLRQPWADATTGIKLSPSELIEKLIALIPPRSCPLVRYGGVFAPNFKRRDEIILCPGQRKRKVSVGAPPCAGKSSKVQVDDHVATAS
jgi:hypothetical protein